MMYERLDVEMTRYITRSSYKAKVMMTYGNDTAIDAVAWPYFERDPWYLCYNALAPSLKCISPGETMELCMMRYSLNRVAAVCSCQTLICNKVLSWSCFVRETWKRARNCSKYNFNSSIVIGPALCVRLDAYKQALIGEERKARGRNLLSNRAKPSQIDKSGLKSQNACNFRAMQFFVACIQVWCTCYHDSVILLILASMPKPIVSRHQ